MLLITHDLAIVAQMAHRVALMYAGQIVEVAEAKEFFARPLHPYAVNLFEALPDTAKRGRRLASIAGSVPPLNQEFAGCRFADRCADVMDRCRVDAAAADRIPAGPLRCAASLRRHRAHPSAATRVWGKDPVLPADPPEGDDGAGSARLQGLVSRSARGS